MANLRQRQLIQRYNKERQRNILAQPGPNDFIIVLDALKPGYNVAKIFRSAEAFGAAAVHLVNVGTFDPAPAKGSFRKVPAVFHEHFGDCYEMLLRQGYTLFQLVPGIGNLLPALQLPRKSAYIFGHEEFGQSFEPEDFPLLQPLTIPQFGKVQSLNVSIAASIVMYEHVRRHGSAEN